MAIEVRGRMFIPHAPIDPDEVARKADLIGGTSGIGFFTFEQDSGNLYFVADLAVRDDMFEYDSTDGNLYYIPPEAP